MRPRERARRDLRRSLRRRPAEIPRPERPRRRWRAEYPRSPQRSRRSAAASRAAPVAARRLARRARSGLELELGPRRRRAALARFVRAWPKLAAQGVETRYATCATRTASRRSRQRREANDRNRARDTRNLLVALDIGTSKIVTLVAEITPRTR
jgi:hypothetical protein